MNEYTLKQAYDKGREILNNAGYAPGEPDARILLCHCLGISREFFYANLETEMVTHRQWKHYEESLRLRLARMPVAYITGVKEFMGLEFMVGRDVLIPRPATETLVERALELLKTGDSPEAKILDIGCGSGCIGHSIAFYNERVRVFQADISLEALAVCKKNLDRLAKLYGEKKLAERVDMAPGNLFEPVPAFYRGRTKLALSNPPYVTSHEWRSLMDGVRLYEPEKALVPPHGAQAMYSSIAEGAFVFLEPGGILLVEIGKDQGDLVEKIFHEKGFCHIHVYKDIEGFNRVVEGKKQTRP